jgi:3-isopropylmalate/(R)-2-methylmalate dehydratase small subunit
MKLGIHDIAKHCLEGVRPEFAAEVSLGDVLAAGPNFGIGSSREQAADALVKLGVKAVIAPSYSGLYFRNAFNLGLLLLTCKDAELLQEAEHISLDLNQWAVVRSNGQRLACDPIPDFLVAMVEAGGLLPQLKLRLQQQRASQ